MKKSLLFSFLVTAMIVIGCCGIAMADVNIYVTADQDIVSGWDYSAARKGSPAVNQPFGPDSLANPNIVQAGFGDGVATYRDTTLTFDLNSLASYALDAIEQVTLNYNVLTSDLGYSGKPENRVYNTVTTVGTVSLGATSYTLNAFTPTYEGEVFVPAWASLDFTAAVKEAMGEGTTAVFRFLHDPDLNNADPLLATRLNKITFGSADGGQAAFLSAKMAAPVPVPAAIWLLGSALAGLGVIRRRAVA